MSADLEGRQQLGQSCKELGNELSQKMGLIITL